MPQPLERIKRLSAAAGGSVRAERPAERSVGLLLYKTAGTGLQAAMAPKASA
ncbi:hypothetical protein [Paenibacillus pinisoli]|uniref:hypothetical protein n=1 Tax=Paenibacillus pinisoli TaxID=1276110 RepID=UPI0014038FFE|nr:hypothetical protein [Paenibacillus pinisoli]